ncbi:transglutaminase domain-containing protein [Butyrivibrio sp. CB08]|uniref:transglutaminase domain-containing protein n=1 Tax=Butyrivibrio sp. CB08 TaxID=2364879 RepID=UPI00131483CD|nr:transglutaminase domain-containing protein [Butyrivibrio sp. CB08]
MTAKKDKNWIKIKFKVCVALMVAAVLLIPPARAAKVDAKELTKISGTTFKRNTQVSTIHIGSDVSEISSNAFRGLINLQSITVSANNPFYTSYSNCLYDKNMTELICFPAALHGAVIPDTVVSIGDNALYGVDQSLKEQVKSVVKAQAAENMMEFDVPGEHFVHTPSGVKWKRADGTIVDPDTDLKKMTAAVVEACTTGDMTQKKQLEKCFNYFVNTSSYERKVDLPIGEWTGPFAADILSTGKGNCYNYASAFAYIAKGLGYDARVCTGTVQSSLGGLTPHAWTEIKFGDEWYIFDTEMQGAKGSGYYKQTYYSYPAAPINKQAVYTISF